MKTNGGFTVFKRSFWVVLTVFFTLLLVFCVVGASVANSYADIINKELDIDAYVKVQMNAGVESDMEYFKSDYVLHNDDGSIKTETEIFEANGEEIGRYTYQLHDDEAMRAASEKVAEQVAVEGTVLLWNDETASGKKALPLAAGSSVSLFGTAQRTNKYIMYGKGSGRMNRVSPLGDSLPNALAMRGLSVDPDLVSRYNSLSSYGSDVSDPTESYGDNYYSRFNVNEAPFSEVESAVDIAAYGDAAIMVINRNAGEDQDIRPSPTANNMNDSYADGTKNYLELSEEEADVLENLNRLKSEGLKSIILVINSANPMQFKNILDDKYGIDACLWVGMGGTASYMQVADALTNKGGYAVSGRSPDTLAMDNRSAPSFENFGDFSWSDWSEELPDLEREGKGRYTTHNLKYIVYQEGEYVGYRYYETRYEDYVLGRGNAGGNAGATDGNGWNYSEEVAFPFGYGLSYTEFSYSDVTFSESDKAITVSVTVTNAGSTYSGKDVVQVYMQRPNAGRTGVEVPAIELVGFAKTGVLAPGADQTVTVTVDKENMRTYDAYGEGTYILERGDYYFSFGTNAHDALNNVLAVKATDEQKTRMDGAGNSAYVYKINVAAADTEIYSVSEESGKEVKIENRLSDADLNLYEGTKNDQSITYLSRSDWNGTYPTSAVSLKCTDETMVRDMQYGHEPEVKEDDEMPVYGTVTAPEGELTLAMFIDLEYDDPKWEDLLNQMTLTEQQWLCSYGLLKMAGATSVAAPGAKAIDGPGGVKNNNPVAGQQFGFPSPVVMAQTWDTALIEKLGVAFAHEALHVGIAVLYAPGANIHRSLYSGRNWEYYSEDGFLSGKILSAEVTGLQSKGIMVMTKHFAFNDQERNRYGVATFFNEQSAREIYLRPFEIAVREGNMNGVMSSFNRIGCTWAGAHKGLLTDILRDEWNFIGMVETDSCTGNTFHMGDKWAKAEGLVAGNDLWMANGSETYFEDSKDNPTVMLALRKACHRILYNQLHSFAMNGVSTSTRIIKITPWWQIALTSAAVTMGVITLACVVMAVLSFIFASEKYKAWLRASAAKKAEKAAAEAEASKAAAYSRAGGNAGGASGGADGESGDEPPKKKSWFARHRKLLILIGSVVIAVIVIVAIVVPVTTCGGATQPSPTPTPEPEPTPEVHVCEQVCPICGGCLDAECEDPACATKCGAGKEAHVFEAEDAEIADGAATYAGYDIITSGDRTYIGNLNHNTGATVTFTVNAQAAATVSLVVTINRRNAQTVFTDRFGVSVNNGSDLDRPTIVPAYADQWTDASFMDFNLGCIDLEAGKNTIRFTVLTTGDLSGYNFDKITLLSDVAVTEPHECTSVCPICGGCLDSECENPVCATKCGAGKDAYVFEAEDAEIADGPAPYAGYGIINSGDRTYIGNLNQNTGATVTFTVNAEEAATVSLVVTVNRRFAETVFTEKFGVSVNNGSDLDRPTIVPAYADQWADASFMDFNLGCIDLEAGKNTIRFTVLTTDDLSGYNFDKITLLSDVAVTEPHECTSVCTICGGCMDAECDAPACETKCPGHDMQSLEIIGDKSEYGAGSIGYPIQAPDAGAPEGLVGKLSVNVGASLTFRFKAATGGRAKLVANVTTRYKELNFTDFMSVEVNGAPYETSAKVPSDGSDHWTVPTAVELGVIDLTAGAVTEVKFTVITPDDQISFNFYSLEVVREDITSVKLDGLTQAALGSGKNGLPNQSNNVVGNLSENVGASLTFKFTAGANGTADLIAAVTSRYKQTTFSNYLKITVNGTVYETNAQTPSGSSDNWYTTQEVPLGNIAVKKGINTVKFTVVSSDTATGVNFGYIKVESYTAISSHVCTSVCEDCGKCMDVTCAELGCTDKCADHVSVTLKGSEAQLGAGTKGDLNYELRRDGLIGNLNENEGATLTFTVDSATGGKARLIAAVSTRTSAIKFTDSMSVTVNAGEPITSDATVPATAVEGDGKVVDNWLDTVEIDLGEITLDAGSNTIVFTRLSPDVLGFNFGYIRVVTDIAQA